MFSFSSFCLVFHIIFFRRRLYDDILELVEHSLDFNLVGNQVRYKFQDSPVLEGLTIHETQQGIVVLVCTVSSIHRLKFSYHDRGNRQVCLLQISHSETCYDPLLIFYQYLLNLLNF